MIDEKTFTVEHFNNLIKNRNVNPPILERALFALGLLEALRKVGLSFIFKGGSSLMLLLDKPMRLSTDVDILVEPGTDIDGCIEKASHIFPFIRKEESVRQSNKSISKRHFRFYFRSIIDSTSILSILLDAVFEKNPYPHLVEKDISNDLLLTSGDNYKVVIPSVNSIVGDKLTAFAPHTIGVSFFADNYANDKRLEVMKQFYDVAILFDYVNNFEEARNSYLSVCKNELVFRGLSIGYKDCLFDAYNCALTIFLRGNNGDSEYINYVEGARRIRGHIFGEVFSSEIAVLHAPKVMLLAACFYHNINPKKLSFDSFDIANIPYIRKFASLGNNEKTRHAFEYAVMAISLMQL